jgi:hypothetical protein
MQFAVFRDSMWVADVAGAKSAEDAITKSNELGLGVNRAELISKTDSDERPELLRET